MNGELTIRPADDAGPRKRFVDLPRRLYRNNSNWVPPLASAQGKVLACKTPFFERAEMALFLAERSGQAVGRIAAIHNRAHADHYRDGVGFFGFFECDTADAQPGEVARALLGRAEGWLRDRGLTRVRGPVNPSMNAECGLLIEGFDRPPSVMMPYNPAAYAALLESAGLAKCKDLYAYLVDVDVVRPGSEAGDRLVRIAAAIRRRHPEITLRRVDMANFSREILRFMGVFEEARRNNWGYVPTTEQDILDTAGQLKRVVDPEIVLLAEVDGEPAGALLAIPNVNLALAAVHGRLFPFGFIKFFRVLKRIREMRVLGVAALEKYRHKGITALLLLEVILRGSAKGYHHAEASWVLEDNQLSDTTIRNALHPVRYKTYRMYEKPIGA